MISLLSATVAGDNTVQVQYKFGGVQLMAGIDTASVYLGLYSEFVSDTVIRASFWGRDGRAFASPPGPSWKLCASPWKFQSSSINRDTH